MVYSMFCCCCAMGDIGCYTRKRFYCYVPYCLLAWCPCCVGCARETLAENLNLPVAETEPQDWSWCLVKFIGMRMLCLFTVCLFPCLHVTQMRAELAHRRHGEATLCPCCCLECGDQKDVRTPGGPELKLVDVERAPDSPGYPRQPGFGGAAAKSTSGKNKGGGKMTAVSQQPPNLSQQSFLAMQPRILSTQNMYSHSRAPTMQNMYQQSRSLSMPNMYAQAGPLTTQSMYSTNPAFVSTQDAIYGSHPGVMATQQNYFASQTGQYGHASPVSMISQPYAAQPSYPVQSRMYGQPFGLGVPQQMMQR